MRALAAPTPRSSCSTSPAPTATRSRPGSKRWPRPPAALYLKTFRLPGLATRTLSQAISGYYVLTLDRSQLGAQPARKIQKLAIELRDARRGTVLARPAWVH